MNIKTKNQLTVAQIDAIITKSLKGCRLAAGENSVKELTEGMCNTAYMVRISDGREAVLKIAPPQNVLTNFYEKNMMDTEVKSLVLIKNKTQVPVPTIYAYDSSKELCDSDYFLMEKLEGDSFSSVKDQLSAEVQGKIYEEIGQYTKQFHQLEGSYFGYPGIPELQFSTMRALYVSLIDHILEDGRAMNVDLGIPYEQVKECIIRHLNVLDEVTKPKFVHWDLWEGNVFVQRGKITGIIDFERVLYADPLMEVLFSDGMDSNSDYLKGYGKKRFSEVEITRRTLYNVYLYLIMTIECKYRQFPEDHWQYPWAKERLAEELKKL